MEYDIGQAVEIWIADIKNEDGETVDPFDITLTVVKPGGTSTDYAVGDLEHVATGHYRLFVTPQAGESGKWEWRFEAINPDTAKEGEFDVRRSRVLGGATPRLNTGTCSPWAEVGDVTSGPAADYGFDSALLADGIQVASDILFELTRRQWPGECEETVRPCGYGTTLRSLKQDPVSGYVSGGWCGCRSSRVCGCSPLSEHRLPGYPVRDVVSVKIDGVILDRARYRVDDRRWLVYLPDGDDDPRQGWPCCQRLDLADTEEDTWSITYVYGTAPPSGGVKAAARLGAQLALAWSPGDASKSCQLPQRVTTISRAGVSMTVLDPMTLISEGRTGLADVDLWVSSILKGLANRPATVHIPGEAASHRRTG